MCLEELLNFYLPYFGVGRTRTEVHLSMIGIPICTRDAITSKCIKHVYSLLEHMISESVDRKSLLL